MKKATPHIPFAGSQLGDIRHVCAFFNSDDEAYRVLLPFIKGGFECGDKAVHVVNPDQCHNHLRRLAAAGIDTTAAQQNGQFELRSNTGTYLRDGRFDRDRMLEVFEQLAGGNAIRAAIERDRSALQKQAETRGLRERYEQLTPREREVVTLVAESLLNKQVAGELSTTEATIKFHRAHIMQKMRANSLADLIRTFEKLGSSRQRQTCPIEPFLSGGQQA